jgi:hypothetical protein
MVMGLSSSKLLGSGSLGLGVEILDFSFTKDTIKPLASYSAKRESVFVHVSAAGWGLVDLWLVDDEKDLLQKLACGEN